MDYIKVIEDHLAVVSALQQDCQSDISRFAEACREAHGFSLGCAEGGEDEP